MSRSHSSVAALLGVLTLANVGRAHIALLEPQPRANGASEGNLKAQPCGQNQNGRVADRVSVFAPGQTITLRWDEYINHDSYYRVAIEMEGDDFVQRPPQNISSADDDPVAEEMAIDTGQLLAVIEDNQNGGVQTARVTLPDRTCDDCTLQLIQFMYNRSDTYYYQCADIVIRAGATDAGSSPPAPDAGTGGGMGGSGSGSGGGCAVGGAGGSAPAAWVLLGLVGLCGARRWRR